MDSPTADGKDGYLKWREKVGGSYSASPILGWRIYVSNEQGETIIFTPILKI